MDLVEFRSCDGQINQTSYQVLILSWKDIGLSKSVDKQCFCSIGNSDGLALSTLHTVNISSVYSRRQE